MGVRVLTPRWNPGPTGVRLDHLHPGWRWLRRGLDVCILASGGVDGGGRLYELVNNVGAAIPAGEGWAPGATPWGPSLFSDGSGDAGSGINFGLANRVANAPPLTVLVVVHNLGIASANNQIISCENPGATSGWRINSRSFSANRIAYQCRIGATEVTSDFDTPTNRAAAIAVTHAANNDVIFWMDGLRNAKTAGASQTNNTGCQLVVGLTASGFNQGNNQLEGHFVAAFVWNYILPDWALQALTLDPFVWLRPERRPVVRAAAGGGGGTPVPVGVPFSAAAGADYAPALGEGLALAVPFNAETGAEFVPAVAAQAVGVAVPFSAIAGAEYPPTVAVTPQDLTIPFAAAGGADFAPAIEEGTPAGVVSVPFAPEAGTEWAPSITKALAIAVPLGMEVGEDWAPRIAVPGALEVPFAGGQGADHTPELRVTVVALQVPLAGAAGIDYAPGVAPGSLMVLIPFSPSAGLAFAPRIRDGAFVVTILPRNVYHVPAAARRFVAPAAVRTFIVE